MKCKSITLLVFALIFLLLSIIFLIIALASEYWLNIYVRRSVVFVEMKTERAWSVMYNLTLPHFPVPYCTCEYCWWNETNTTTTDTTNTTTEQGLFYPPPPFDESDLGPKGIRIMHDHDHLKVIERKPPETNEGIETKLPTDKENFSTPIINYRYFSRVVGLFLICFTEVRPKELDQNCMDINYATINSYNNTEQTSSAWKRLHMLRSVVAFLILAILVALIVFCTLYILGCLGWNPFVLGILSLILLAGLLFGIIAMVLFHLAKKVEERSWEQTVRLNTFVEYDWAYVLAWIGIILFLINAFLINMFAAQMQQEIDNNDDTSVFYYYYYGGRI